jgi:hypothetical protein
MEGGRPGQSLAAAGFPKPPPNRFPQFKKPADKPVKPTGLLVSKKM